MRPRSERKAAHSYMNEDEVPASGSSCLSVFCMVSVRNQRDKWRKHCLQTDEPIVDALNDPSNIRKWIEAHAEGETERSMS